MFESYCDKLGVWVRSFVTLVLLAADFNGTLSDLQAPSYITTVHRDFAGDEV